MEQLNTSSTVPVIATSLIKDIIYAYKSGFSQTNETNSDP